MQGSLLSSRASRIVFTALLVCLGSTLKLKAQTIIHVPADQPSIQAAITAAQPGDTVLVSPGTYVENINFQGEAVTVASSDGPGVTTIDGHLGNDSVVKFTSGEGNGSVLKGFTITRGNSFFNAGGITINNSSPIVDGNVITGNQTCDSGAGMQVQFSSAIVRNNTITNNVRASCSGGTGGGGILIGGAGSAQILNNTIANNSMPNTADGGGISLNAAGTPTIAGNTITANFASGNGGGIAMGNQSDANITNNLIYGNTSQGKGGGVYFLVPGGARGPFLVNNTIANNSAASGSAVFADGFDTTTKLINNIFFSNSISPVVCGNFTNGQPIISSNDAFSPAASGFSGVCTNLNGASGNLSADPLFVNVAAGNFRLTSGSPAIDGGSNSAPNLPAQDLDGHTRIAFGNASTCSNTVDQGAYEFSLTTSPAATLSASTLDFGIVAVGTTTVAQSLTYTGTQGCVSAPTITVSGDYHETDNCSAVLGTGASCTIQVTFSPAASGTRPGTLTVSSGSLTANATLSGQGGAAIASLAPGNMDFGNQLLATTSAGRVLTLTNSGNTALQVNGITVSGDFAQTNNCPASVAAGASCSISITFTPTSSGTRNGTVVISSNGGPASAGLTGFGITDFRVTASPASATVKAGSSAQSTITVSALGSSLSNAVNLSCSGLPTGAACAFSPGTIQAGVASGSSTVTISTSSSSGGKNPTPHGTYTITIRAASSQFTHSTVISLTVR